MATHAIAKKQERKTEKPAAAEARRGPDDSEITEIVGSRQDAGTVWAESKARQEAAALKSRAEAEDRSAAKITHANGVALTHLYLHHGDAQLGYASFDEMLRDVWPLGRKKALECMRIVKFATDAQLEKYKYERTKLGVRLVKAMGLVSLSDLEAKDIRLPAGHGPTKVRFANAKCWQLEGALRLLKAPAAEVAPVHAGSELGETRTWLQHVCEKDAEIKALQPIAFFQEGKIRVRVTAAIANAAAAARFYGQLARRKK